MGKVQSMTVFKRRTSLHKLALTCNVCPLGILRFVPCSWIFRMYVWDLTAGSESIIENIHETPSHPNGRYSRPFVPKSWDCRFVLQLGHTSQYICFGNWHPHIGNEIFDSKLIWKGAGSKSGHVYAAWRTSLGSISSASLIRNYQVISSWSLSEHLCPCCRPCL